MKDRLYRIIENSYPGFKAFGEVEEIGPHMYTIKANNEITKSKVKLTYMRTADDKFVPVGIEEL